jgi:hypothetical protein
MQKERRIAGLSPLVPAMVAASRAILGESLPALHIVPSLAGAATLVFVCLITRELGGGLFATGVSALGFLIAPVWLTLASFFRYDSIDQLLLYGPRYGLPPCGVRAIELFPLGPRRQVLGCPDRSRRGLGVSQDLPVLLEAIWARLEFW